MNDRLMKSLLSGLAGAMALNILHESVRRVRSDAPRMDVYGRRAIAAGMEAVGIDPPNEDRLQAAALGGDLLSNTLYYSLVGLGEPSLSRGAAIGAVAGVGAVVLPPLMGLGRRPGARTPQTSVMTICWYLVGGLAAAAAYRFLAGDPFHAAAPTPPASPSPHS